MAILLVIQKREEVEAMVAWAAACALARTLPLLVVVLDKQVAKVQKKKLSVQKEGTQ